MRSNDKDTVTGLVTIGITAFNAVDTFNRALESALRQTWQQFEIIAVDDCSTDGTLETLIRHAESIRELRAFSNAMNAGVAVGRNRIISEARGEFIAFFDDDDISDPSRIERQVQRILQYEATFALGAPVICHTARTLVHDDGLCYTVPTMGQREDRRAPAGIDVARRILVGIPLEDAYGAIPTCSQMARTATYRELGGFDAGFRRSEDTEFNVRLARNGGHFVGIGDPLVTQYMTRTSEKSLKEELRNMRLLMQKHRDIIEADGLYDFCMLWLDAKYLLLEKKRFRFIMAMVPIAARWPFATLQRLFSSWRNISLNVAFSRFHR